MSQYAVTQSPPPKVRPGVVTAAVALIWVIIGLEIISIIAGLIGFDASTQAQLDAYNAEHPEDSPASPAATSVLSFVVIGIILAGLAVLAFFLLRGSQPARIVTWVVGGLGAVCQGCLSATVALAVPLLSASGGDDPDIEAQRQLFNLLANTWQFRVQLGVFIVDTLLLLLMIILLAVPAANDFFRKEQEVWVPPTTFTGFPPTPPPAVPQDPMAPPPPPAAPPSA